MVRPRRGHRAGRRQAAGVRIVEQSGREIPAFMPAARDQDLAGIEERGGMVRALRSERNRRDGRRRAAGKRRQSKRQK